MIGVIAAYVRRDFAVARSYRVGIVLQTIAGVTALFVVFRISRVVEPVTFAHAAGIRTSYFAFVVLGLMVMRIAQVAISSAPTRLRSEQSVGTLEAVLSTPTPASVALLSGTAYDVLSGLFQAALLLVLAVLGFGLGLHGGPTELAVVLLALAGLIATMSAVAIVLAAATLMFKQLPSLATMVGSLLAIVSGVWFPVHLLPAGLVALAKLSPVYWALQVTRGALLAGRVDDGSLVALLGTAAVALPLALGAYELCLRHVRRTGTLALY
jgi:ABC-2 type transport system permease protein